MMTRQKTLNDQFHIKGKGLHSGGDVELTIKPADENSGIVFKKYENDNWISIRATIEHSGAPSTHCGRQTALVAGISSLQTIEHLMAAFSCFGIDNAIVEVVGNELPALDGSALPYAEGILRVGVREQSAEREYVLISEPLYLDYGDISAVVLPASEFRISYTLSYGHSSLSDQFVSFVIDEDVFLKELAPARTFCLKHEADALLSKGYGKGANYKNTLVFQDNEPVENELRFPDEAARHKVVDLIGDLYLLGSPLRGHVMAYRSGHAQNYELVKKITQLKTKKRDAGVMRPTNEIINKKQLDIEEIKSILPHRFPFLFIDRVIDLIPGERAVAIKNVSQNEQFFQGHFPGHPIMPGVIIVEAMAQLGGIVTLNKEDSIGKIAYFMSIDKAKFRAPVVPGDQLRLEVEVVKSKGRVGQCLGKAYVESKLVCEAELKFALVDK